MTALSEHFTAAELCVSQWAARRGVSNAPPPDVLANLRRTAATMEHVRAVLNGKPLLVSSGYRSPRVNAAIGGARNSAHLRGLAVDFTCPGFGSHLAVCRAIEAGDIAYDQLIHEYPPNGWVHIDFDLPARRQELTKFAGRSGYDAGLLAHPPADRKAA